MRQNINNDTLNIVYSSDDNYAQHTGVSIISLLENNKHFMNIDIYIIDNNIRKTNKDKLNDIVKQYKRNIKFIKFNDYIEKLNLNMAWKVSISAYARLFIASILPENIERILYFDCDTVIVDKLDEIWHEDISNYSVAGVEDTVNENMKKLVGMKTNDKYINSGVLLINLKKWRQENVEIKYLKFIETYNGNVAHHDQGVINGVLNKNIKLLNLKFNIMTVFYTMKRDNIIKFYKINNLSYSKEEIYSAIRNPVCIHYTQGFSTRPWMKRCNHPMKHIYWKYLKLSPWKDFKAKKSELSIKNKIVNVMYTRLNFNCVDLIIKKME